MKQTTREWIDKAEDDWHVAQMSHPSHLSLHAVVYPVLKLNCWHKVLKIRCVSRNQDVMSSDSLSGNDEIGVALAGLALFLESVQYVNCRWI